MIKKTPLPSEAAFLFVLTGSPARRLSLNCRGSELGAMSSTRPYSDKRRNCSPRAEVKRAMKPFFQHLRIALIAIIVASLRSQRRSETGNSSRRSDGR